MSERSELRDQIPPEAQAALLAVFAALAQRLDRLEQENECLTQQVQELHFPLNLPAARPQRVGFPDQLL